MSIANLALLGKSDKNININELTLGKELITHDLNSGNIISNINEQAGSIILQNMPTINAGAVFNITLQFSNSSWNLQPIFLSENLLNDDLNNKLLSLAVKSTSPGQMIITIINNSSINYIPIASFEVSFLCLFNE